MMAGLLLAAPISSNNDLIGYTCGNESIDKLVRESFLSHICGQRTTFKILFDDSIVGFYSLYISSIIDEESNEPFTEYYDQNPRFAVVYIKYLAVNKAVQGNGIGSSVLGHIVKEARHLSEKWPVRLIVFDALRDKVEWYKKLGFDILSQKELDGNSETVKMYFDMFTEEKRQEISEYCEQNM